MSFPIHLPAALGSAGTSSQCGPRSAGDMRPLCRSGPRQRISVETIYGHLITIDPGPSCAVAYSPAGAARIAAGLRGSWLGAVWETSDSDVADLRGRGVAFAE